MGTSVSIRGGALAGACASRPAGRGICAQCRNKAEVKTYPNDNPDPICEKCYVDNQRLEKKIAEKGGAAIASESAPSRINEVLGASDERERYIQAIIQGASDKWIESFIKEVVVKNVLRYDWKEIIKFERWFSILDLRRFALEVNPNFEQLSNATEVASEPVKKPKRKQRTKGAANAD